MKLWRSKKCAACIYMGQVEEANTLTVKYKEGNTQGEKDVMKSVMKAIVIRPAKII